MALPNHLPSQTPALHTRTTNFFPSLHWSQQSSLPTSAVESPCRNMPDRPASPVELAEGKWVFLKIVEKWKTFDPWSPLFSNGHDLGVIGSHFQHPVTRSLFGLLVVTMHPAQHGHTSHLVSGSLGLPSSLAAERHVTVQLQPMGSQNLSSLVNPR